MGKIYHQLVLYGVGSATCFAMAIATERAAAAAPFVSRIHAIPELPATKTFDQRTRGGEDLGGARTCTAQTRILLKSDLPIESLKSHYKKHPVQVAHGEGEVTGVVWRPEDVKDLVSDWEHHRKDSKVYLVEFVSPGTPGTEAECRF
ncbi:hypothetical protein EON81_09095 [bacterium]|nr:MAG: hypothetical protein EON81_09095 [bacterium]